mgnify:CR=1 FL=1
MDAHAETVLQNTATADIAVFMPGRRGNGSLRKSYSESTSASHASCKRATRAAISHYRARFTPSRHHAVPYASAAVSVICAPQRDEAEHLASSVRLMRRRLHGGAGITPLAPPEQAIRALGELPAEPASRNEWPALILGTPGRVGEVLEHMVRELSLDELHIVTVTHDPRMRLRSYELLAAHFGLAGVAG